MVDVELVPFDPHKATGAEGKRFHAFRRLRHREWEPDDPIRSDSNVETSLRQPEIQWHEERVAAITSDQEEQVGALWFEIAKEESPDYEENKHLAWSHVEVLSPYRRRGVGARLLAEAVRLAKLNGRSLLIGWSDEEDGKAFVEAIGAEVAQRSRESRLYLDRLDWGMIERWAAEGPERSPSTTLRFFDNHIPKESIEDFTEVLSESFNQMPRDALKRGDWIITPKSIRQFESEFKEMGAHRLTAATFEATGKISGLTEMGYFPEEEWLIHQYMTGVRPPHRSRGLGKWLKAAMLLKLREEFPQVRVVSTANATTNAPMLDINVRLGFKLHREAVIAQIPVEEAEAYLHGRSDYGRGTQVRTRRDSNPGSPA